MSGGGGGGGAAAAAAATTSQAASELRRLACHTEEAVSVLHEQMQAAMALLNARRRVWHIERAPRTAVRAPPPSEAAMAEQQQQQQQQAAEAARRAQENLARDKQTAKRFSKSI